MSRALSGRGLGGLVDTTSQGCGMERGNYAPAMVGTASCRKGIGVALLLLCVRWYWYRWTSSGFEEMGPVQIGQMDGSLGLLCLRLDVSSRSFQAFSNELIVQVDYNGFKNIMKGTQVMANNKNRGADV